MRRMIVSNAPRWRLVAALGLFALLAACAGGPVADGGPTRTVFVEPAAGVVCDLDGDGIVTVGELRACGGR